jgi:hypothetical protein
MSTQKRFHSIPYSRVISTGLVEISRTFLRGIPRDGFVEKGVDIRLIGGHQTISN